MITPEVLSDAARELLDLPRLAWHEDPAFGVTLTASGTDDDVKDVVWKYASLFGLKPTVVRPTFRPGRVVDPGWISVELPILGPGITVAGRLMGDADVCIGGRE